MKFWETPEPLKRVAAETLMPPTMPYAFDTAPTLELGEVVVQLSFEAFVDAFEKRFPDIHRRLSSAPIDNWIIAGGSVLGCLLQNPAPDFDASDIDLFLYHSTETEANECVRNIWEALAVDGEYWCLERTNFVINMYRFKSGGRKVPKFFFEHSQPAKFEGLGEPTLQVQVILHTYLSPSEVLHGFDVDCAALAFNGTAVWGLPRTFRALQGGFNVSCCHSYTRMPEKGLQRFWGARCILYMFGGWGSREQEGKGAAGRAKRARTMLRRLKGGVLHHNLVQ